MNLLQIIKRHEKGASISVESAFSLISQYVFDLTNEYPSDIRFQNGNNMHMQQINYAMGVAAKYFDENKANLSFALDRARKLEKK